MLVYVVTGSMMDLVGRTAIKKMDRFREEGLLPYMPELPRPFEMQINYNQSVYNIRGIHTAAAGLESTSLVLCYGLGKCCLRNIH